MTIVYQPTAADIGNEPTVVNLAEDAKLGDIYNLPGEGFVVELLHGDATYLFDKQGLQSRIIDKKKLGLDATVEETALHQINNFAPVW